MIFMEAGNRTENQKLEPGKLETEEPAFKIGDGETESRTKRNQKNREPEEPRIGRTGNGKNREPNNYRQLS